MEHVRPNFKNVKFFFRQFVIRNVENCIFVSKKNRRIHCEALKLLLMYLDKFVDFSLNIVLRDFLENE